ncbi:beta-glucosidase [Marinicellulosiphila megalodicopiae]|uniref:beta-glucosidase n=1 Tax=Marinicellulosiphila megalodicopiae TaxID=2724896 RepID=UPI003BAEBE3D
MNSTIIQNLLNQLTLEEKAQLCTGKDFWHLHGNERLNLPSIMLTDGPHGLRKQAGEGDHVGLNDSVKATCFPTASGLAATWNLELIEQMGVALGKECRAENVSVLLGPGVNLKRHPLGGRNFEYFSEDPLLSGQLSAAWINGVQSQKVGTSLKHYAVNNHENCRMTVDAIVDERTLREIYLPAFEIAVKQSQPWTIMSSYNLVNGIYASEHPVLLDEILYKQWNFQGVLVTDWGANSDRVAGLKAGQTLEMPSSGDLNTNKILKAITDGNLSLKELDDSVALLLNLILKSKAALDETQITVNLEDHHKLAAKIAEQTAVLLKNDNQFLPLTQNKKIAVIGEFAKAPRYQGAGSSKINPFKLETPLEELENVFGKNNIQYAQGFSLNDETSQTLIDEALHLAEQSDVVIFFAGLTPKYESEGFDRKHLDLPQVQLTLIEAMQPYLNKTVMVLQNGAPILMPFADSVPAILEAYLGGQAGASAIANILKGSVNPSGKLAETFPLNLESIASDANFPGTNKQVQYREGIWVGYRYFDTADQPVLFPFGHGLSYTQFEYSDLVIEGFDDRQMIDFTKNDSFKVKVTVKNIGDVFGAEIVQLYIAQQNPSVPRPNKELKGYGKVFLEPGESQEITIKLTIRDFSYWSTVDNNWNAPSDVYNIQVGASINDIKDSCEITIETNALSEERATDLDVYFSPKAGQFDDQSFANLLGYEIPKEMPVFPYHFNSTIGDIAHTEAGKEVFDKTIFVFTKMFAGDENSEAAKASLLMAKALVDDMPLRNLPIFGDGQFSEPMLEQLIIDLNKAGV